MLAEQTDVTAKIYRGEIHISNINSNVSIVLGVTSLCLAGLCLEDIYFKTTIGKVYSTISIFLMHYFVSLFYLFII